ncbi:hypothetical protein QE152_g23430 [Popillia japonica]|uniref:Uncharacterized protein n=1 Tax=Popillia japonica TaxID=7064 RepID=A0AAW1KHW2_POPJA
MKSTVREKLSTGRHLEMKERHPNSRKDVSKRPGMGKETGGLERHTGTLSFLRVREHFENRWSRLLDSQNGCRTFKKISSFYLRHKA